MDRLTNSANQGWTRLVRLRPKVWAGLLLLAAMAFGGHLLWSHFSPTVGRHPQYLVTAETVHITPPPPWIRSDIKAEVWRDAGLGGNLSLLDDQNELVRRVTDAFEFHPWVIEVQRLEKRLPGSLDIQLTYRQPVAAVESNGEGGATLLPVDTMGVRLPDADFTNVERRYLPRITGIAGRPAVGDAWPDHRVQGGVRLAAELGNVWQSLRLVEITPSQHQQVHGGSRFYSFQIVTGGGTRIVWGAAPGEETLAGESPFATKLQRLLGYATNKGQLDSIEGPETVDVRSDLIVVPRTVRRDPAAADQTDENLTAENKPPEVEEPAETRTAVAKPADTQENPETRTASRDSIETEETAQTQ